MPDRSPPLMLVLALTSAGCSPLLGLVLDPGDDDDVERVVRLDHPVAGNTSRARDHRETTCGSPDGSGDHLWRFHPPADGTYRVHVVAHYDSVVAVRHGQGFENEIACNDDHTSNVLSESMVSLSMKADDVYGILVDGYSGAEGEYELTVHSTQAGGGPLALDQPVTGDSSTSIDSYMPSCGASLGSPDDVWTFTPRRTGNYRFRVDSQYDAVLAVFDDTGAEQGCNDDHGSTQASEVVVRLRARQDYLVVVDGYAGGSGAYGLEATRARRKPPRQGAANDP